MIFDGPAFDVRHFECVAKTEDHMFFWYLYICDIKLLHISKVVQQTDEIE